MTGGLLGAVVVTGMLGLVNLLLTYGVVRRLREHERLLAERDRPRPDGPALGSTMPKFAAATTDGVDITHEAFLAGDVWIGFFSPKCTPCREQLPAFVQAASATNDVRLLVVVGRDGADADDLARFAAQAGSVSEVVIEDLQGPVSAAFGVDATPSLLRYTDGALAASGYTVDKVFTPAPAA